MAKASKPKEDKKKRGKYDEKLVINGSFMEIIKAAVKNADENSKSKKKVEAPSICRDVVDGEHKGG